MELNVCLKSSSVWKYFSGSKPSSHSELYPGSCFSILSQKATPQTDGHVSWPSACVPICSDGMCSLASCLDSFLTVPVPSNTDLISSLNTALFWSQTAPMNQTETALHLAPFNDGGCACQRKQMPEWRKDYDHSIQAFVDGLEET